MGPECIGGFLGWAQDAGQMPRMMPDMPQAGHHIRRPGDLLRLGDHLRRLGRTWLGDHLRLLIHVTRCVATPFSDEEEAEGGGLLREAIWWDWPSFR